MKIVVVGGSGLIGKKLIAILNQEGHQAVPASPSTGVNALTGEGLAQALQGADVVVELTNPPTFDPKQVLEFFTTTAANLTAAERTAGVKHHIALSIVGADRMPGSGYMPGKIAQEEAIKTSGIPYTIVRATQFFEFVEGIAAASTEDGVVKLSSTTMQPIAADDVAAALAQIVTGTPRNATIDLAGPEKIAMDELARRLFTAKKMDRKVVTRQESLYFGAKVDNQSLIPLGDAILGTTKYGDWLKSA